MVIVCMCIRNVSVMISIKYLNDYYNDYFWWSEPVFEVEKKM